MPVRSMTGYGSGVSGDTLICKIEMKSVNHRYSDIVLRCPKEYNVFEDKIRRIVQDNISRGRVEIYMNVEDFGNGRRTVLINKDLVEGYSAAFHEIERILGTQVDTSVIPTLPDVLSVTEEAFEPDEVWTTVESAVRQALTSLITMRDEEGGRLLEDILGRLQTYEELIDKISERAPEIITAYRDRLHKRIEEWSGVEVDPARLAAEVAIYADRSAIDEEIVRTRSHIAQLRDILKQDEPVGRKLDFLIQEMNREINTLGSKALDVDISPLVVEGKSVLEKIREQVQNVE